MCETIIGLYESGFTEYIMKNTIVMSCMTQNSQVDTNPALTGDRIVCQEVCVCDVCVCYKLYDGTAM